MTTSRTITADITSTPLITAHTNLTSGFYCSFASGNGRTLATRSDSNNSSNLSTDGGFTWSSLAMPTTDYWAPPCYGGDRFVTSGYSTFYYLIDGSTTWSAGAYTGGFPTDSYKIIYVNGRFLATRQYAPVLFYSDDGMTTVSTATPFPTSNSYQLVGSMGDVVVAYESTTPSVAISYNKGTTWQTLSTPIPTANVVICCEKGLFIGLNTSPFTLAKTTDFETWQFGLFPDVSQVGVITYGYGIFDLDGRWADNHAISTNGLDWTIVPRPVSPTGGVSMGYASDGAAIWVHGEATDYLRREPPASYTITE